MFDNHWNNHLLKKISRVFIKSIDTFSQHPTLKHHWVRYIPAGRIADDFWGRLQTQILSDLASCTVFFSQDQNLLEARQLREVPSRYRDASGQPLQPLLPDLIDGESAYMSEEYDSTLDVPILRKIKSTKLSTQDFLDRIEHDLGGLRLSRIRAVQSQGAVDRHTRIVDQLIAAMEEDPRNRHFLRRLHIVRLNGGRWVRPLNATIFFPTSGGIEISADLPLNLVDAKVLENHSWGKLLSQLGVTECAPVRVFPLIEQQYKSSDKRLDHSLAHIKFMFWHHKELPSQTSQVWLASTYNSIWFKPTDKKHGWVYCPESGGRYTASSLFLPLPEDLSNLMHFVRPAYYDMLQQCPPRNDRTGIEWFTHFFQVKVDVQLCFREMTSYPSAEFGYVIDERPESLLGALKASWSQYNQHPKWDYQLANAMVPVLDSHQPRRLECTYLPLPKLRSIVDRLGLADDFGFLQEIQDITDASSAEWSF